MAEQTKRWSQHEALVESARRATTHARERIVLRGATGVEIADELDEVLRRLRLPTACASEAVACLDLVEGLSEKIHLAGGRDADAFRSVERAIRDVLVSRCWLGASTRDEFMEAAEKAFGRGPLEDGKNQKIYSKLCLAFQKVIGNRAETFLSNNASGMWPSAKKKTFSKLQAAPSSLEVVEEEASLSVHSECIPGSSSSTKHVHEASGPSESGLVFAQRPVKSPSVTFKSAPKTLSQAPDGWLKLPFGGMYMDKSSGAKIVTRNGFLDEESSLLPRGPGSSKSAPLAWMRYPLASARGDGTEVSSLGNVDEEMDWAYRMDPAAGGAKDRSVLVLSELNFVLVWRAWERVDSLQSVPIELPSGHQMYVRPGADQLVGALLREPRCCLAFVSCSGPKYALPMARALLKRAAPGPWEIDETEGQLPSVLYNGKVGIPGQPRVYVIDAQMGASEVPLEKQGNQFGSGGSHSGYVKNVDKICDCLLKAGRVDAFGHPEFDIDNTVILDNWRWSNSHPDSVIELPKWKAAWNNLEGRWGFPLEEESAWESLQEYLFNILADPAPWQALPAHLKDNPCTAFLSEDTLKLLTEGEPSTATASKVDHGQWQTWDDWGVAYFARKAPRGETEMQVQDFRLAELADTGGSSRVEPGARGEGRFRKKWLPCVVVEARDDGVVRVRWGRGAFDDEDRAVGAFEDEAEASGDDEEAPTTPPLRAEVSPAAAACLLKDRGPAGAEQQGVESSSQGLQTEGRFGRGWFSCEVLEALQDGSVRVRWNYDGSETTLAAGEHRPFSDSPELS